MPFRISPFTDAVAVEAWDAWFRWRDHAGLHDLSIEDTWRRVAAELASVEPPAAVAPWRSRFLESLSTWRLLPDERLLASAGTGRLTWSDGDLHASLNAAGFVSAEEYASAQLDLAAVVDCAALAVRALDNAAQLAELPGHGRLRVGLVGVADALCLLGLGYDSEEGRAMAGALGHALAEGCFGASISLARERGASSGDVSRAIAHARQRGLPEHLLRGAENDGLHHAALTAMTSHPRLALLANVVADAIDPLAGENHAHVFVAAGGQRILHSSGFALSMNHTDVTRGARATVQDIGWLPQLRMRAVLQPYMDEPISYPLRIARDPGELERREANLQSARYGLCEPAWQIASSTEYSQAALV